MSVLLFATASGWSAIRYVNTGASGANDGSSWMNAYTELAVALSNAVGGDEIWVAKGIYLPDYDSVSKTHTGNRDLRFVIKSMVAVYGGFDGTETQRHQRNWVVNRTILSGDVGTAGVASDNTRTLMASDGTVREVVLDGLVFANGRADNPAELGNGIVSGSGGALYLRIGGATEVRNCTFINNYAVYGGGIYVASSSGAGLAVVQCLFAANSALYVGGAINHQSYTGTFVVRQSTLIGNSSSRGSAIGTNLAVTCFYYNNLIHSNSLTSTGWQTVETGNAPTAAGNVAQYAMPNATSGAQVVTDAKLGIMPSSGMDGRWGTMDDVLVAALRGDSPVLAAGQLAQVPVDTTDVDGDGNVTESVPLDIVRNPRIRNSIVEAGAFAFKNTAPTSLELSSLSVSENMPTGTTVGTLTATDAEGGLLSYELTAGAGSSDNARFTIAGDSLKTAEVLDFETNPAPSVRLRVSDVSGAWYERTFTLSVADTYDPTLEDFEIGSTSLNIVAVPGFNHAPIRRALTPALAGFDFNAVQVSSSASWVVPSVDIATKELVLNFTTSGLVSGSNPAQITLVNGAVTRVLNIVAAASALNVVRLVDDPVRSLTYGVQQNGTAAGAVIFINPLTNTPVANITVGGRPTDFDIKADGSELIVICSATREIYAINLETRAVSEVIPLALFGTGDVAVTSPHVAYGPAETLYYTDGSWAPLLRVMTRADRLVVQAVRIDTLNATENSSGNGVGDFVVSPDGTALYGWAQYGWGAGWAGSYPSKFSIGSNGRLTHVAAGASSYPTAMSRDPLTTPALISADSTQVFLKQFGFASSDITTPSATFTGPVYAISPGGEITTTTNAIYERSTGIKVHTFTPSSTVQVITSDYSRLVYFDATQRLLRTVNLNETIGQEIMGRHVLPADGSVVLSPTGLSWAPLPGADRYYVYLGTSESAVTGADKTSPEYKGRVLGPTYTIPSPLVAGVTYYWRVDSVIGESVSAGEVRSFTVSTIASSAGRIDTATLRGHASHTATLDLTSANPGATWTASSSQGWIGFEHSTGVTPATLRLTFDTRGLAAGRHEAVVSVATTGGTFKVPVVLQVDPLALNVLKSRPGTTKVYGLSEEGLTYSADGYRAYLLEIDTAFQRISRVVPVGKGATDLTVHEGDGRVYVTNWRTGKLLGVGLSSFQVARTYDMTPFAGVGYGRKDAYRLSAGVAGRLVFEAADQWIDVSLYDTVAGRVLSTSYEREGGGAYAPGKRYYYHGDNNSSGAELHKLDTTGDVFTPLKEVRAVGASYYGSRSVQISEDGTRVVWNGVVFDADLSVLWTPSAEIYSISGNGRYAFGETKIYDTVDQRIFEAMPVTTKVSAFNNSTGRLVVQKNGELLFHALSAIDLPGLVRTPADGSIVLPTRHLSWTPLPGASGYRVYLGTTADGVASATESSPEYLGEFAVSSLDLEELLIAGGIYYWRVDIVIEGEVMSGAVQSFHVSNLATGTTKISTATVQGHARHAHEIPVTAATPDRAWSASTTTPWIRIITPDGSAPGVVKVEFDASELSAGVHQGSVTIDGGVAATIGVPVTLRVDPLQITVIRSDPDSNLVYAVSEATSYVSAEVSPAYLLEIDALDGRILRVAGAGSGVTDLAVHAYDERIYVTNWTLGRLLAFDRDTLVLEKSYDSFTPPASNTNDVYRISAGGPGRLVVEAEDQWIDVSIFNTATGSVLATTSEREGGGAYDAAGRYYFHGDNNISNAALRRFDTAGDQWFETQSIRVTGVSYYGSRNVVMAENGNRVFWNGAAFTTVPFAQEWLIGHDIYASSADGRVAVAGVNVYDVATKSQVMALPTNSAITRSAYNTVCDMLVYQAGNRLVSHAVGYVEPLPVPVLSVQDRTADSVTLAWSANGLRSGFSVQWKPSNSPEWQTVVAVIGGTTSSRKVAGLAAQTAYDFRVRTLNPYHPSAWTDAVSAITLQAPPTLALPDRIMVKAGTTLSYSIPMAEGITYEVEDLPSGVVFDQSTGWLSGYADLPGRYLIRVIANGEGGNATAHIELVFESEHSLADQMVYTGLLAGADNLLGSWRLAREGRNFTATLRTVSGNVAFTGIFPKGDFLRTVSVPVRIARISYIATVKWDRLTDRVAISLQGAINSAATVEETGLALRWNAVSRPYPWPGTYNAIIGTEAQGGAVLPKGRGFLSVNIGKDGKAAITGETALGQAFTWTGVVSENHNILLDIRIDGLLLWGALHITNPTQSDSGLMGVMLWEYAPELLTAPYADGFAAEVRIVGSAYVPTTGFKAIMKAGTLFRLNLSSGGLERTMDDLVQNLSLSTDGLVVPRAGSVNNPYFVNVQLDPRTGILTGSATITEVKPSTGKRVSRLVPFRGMVLRDFDGNNGLYAGGYFILKNWAQRGDDGGLLEFSARGADAPKPAFPDVGSSDSQGSGGVVMTASTISLSPVPSVMGGTLTISAPAN